MFFRRRDSKFKLTFGTASFSKPTARDIASSVRGLKKESDSFLILEPEAGLEGTIYLQASLPVDGYDDGLGYILGIGVQEGNGVALYECRTTDASEVIDVFSDYLEKQKIPDYSHWEKQNMN